MTQPPEQSAVRPVVQNLDIGVGNTVSGLAGRSGIKRMEKRMTPHERAMQIVSSGGQILLPFEAGDASVQWESRRALLIMIVDAIKAEREECAKAAAGYHDHAECGHREGYMDGRRDAFAAIQARS